MRTTVGLTLLLTGMLLLAAGVFLGDPIRHGIVQDGDADLRPSQPWLTIAGMVAIACGMTITARTRLCTLKTGCTPPAAEESGASERGDGVAAGLRTNETD